MRWVISSSEELFLWARKILQRSFWPLPRRFALVSYASLLGDFSASFIALIPKYSCNSSHFELFARFS